MISLYKLDELALVEPAVNLIRKVKIGRFLIGDPEKAKDLLSQANKGEELLSQASDKLKRHDVIGKRLEKVLKKSPDLNTSKHEDIITRANQNIKNANKEFSLNNNDKYRSVKNDFDNIIKNQEQEIANKNKLTKKYLDFSTKIKQKQKDLLSNAVDLKKQASEIPVEKLTKLSKEAGQGYIRTNPEKSAGVALGTAASGVGANELRKKYL